MRARRGEGCAIDGLVIDVAGPQTAGGLKVNLYGLAKDGARVFYGSEGRDLEPLRAFRARHGAVDVACLPIDGSSLLGHRLVMDAAAAVEGARVLGARTLVPIHYGVAAFPGLLQIKSGPAYLKRVADVEVAVTAPGERRVFSARARSV